MHNDERMEREHHRVHSAANAANILAIRLFSVWIDRLRNESARLLLTTLRWAWSSTPGIMDSEDTEHPDELCETLRSKQSEISK